MVSVSLTAELQTHSSEVCALPSERTSHTFFFLHFRRLHCNSYDSETSWNAKAYAIRLLLAAGICRPALQALDQATRFSMHTCPFTSRHVQLISAPASHAVRNWVFGDFVPHLKNVIDNACRGVQCGHPCAICMDLIVSQTFRD